MTKDYKEYNTAHQPGGYGWMFSGIALGLLVGLGMYFYANYQNSSARVDSTEASEPVAFGESGAGQSEGSGGLQEPDPISMVIESARLEQNDRKRASFSYYAVLPNLELDVNVKPSSRDMKSPEQIAAEQAAEATEKVILKPGMHILQIASFKTEPQARRSQKELKAKGLETRIEKRKIKGKDWYRLFAGPTQDQADIQAWNSVVTKAGFKPLIVKVK